MAAEMQKSPRWKMRLANIIALAAGFGLGDVILLVGHLQQPSLDVNNVGLRIGCKVVGCAVVYGLCKLVRVDKQMLFAGLLLIPIYLAFAYFSTGH